MGKYYSIILLLMIFLGSNGPLFAKSDESGVSGIGKSVVLPEKDPQTQCFRYILYAEYAEKIAMDIKFSNVCVDIITKGIDDPFHIKSLNKLSRYNEKSTMKEILQYWDNLPHSSGFIETPLAFLDQKTKDIRGDALVYYYSRPLDVKGKGFYFDYTAQTLKINSQVRVVLRPNTDTQDNMQGK